MPVILSQAFIAVATIVTLFIVYSVCMLLNVRIGVYSSHEHMPIFVYELSYVIAKIHFFVLAVPITMLGIFSIVNIDKQFDKSTILRYAKIVLIATSIAIVIGMIIQTVYIILDNDNNDYNKLL